MSHAHIIGFGFRKECGQLRVLPKASGCMHYNKDLMFGCAAMQPFRDKWPQASLFEGPEIVEDFMWQDDLIGVAILSIHVWKRCILQVAHPVGAKHRISLVWLKELLSDLIRHASSTYRRW